MVPETEGGGRFEVSEKSAVQYSTLVCWEALWDVLWEALCEAGPAFGYLLSVFVGYLMGRLAAKYPSQWEDAEKRRAMYAALCCVILFLDICHPDQTQPSHGKQNSSS